MTDVVLLSGGVDSALCLALHPSAVALSFDYGQTHRAELLAARAIAEHYRAPHKIVTIHGLSGSSLLGDGKIPTGRSEDEIANGIPSTYVPGRNSIFASVAIGLCESLGGGAVVLGVNAIDYSGYPDCRPEWVEAMQTLANVATLGVVTIKAPLVNMTKVDIFSTAAELDVPIDDTVSCYLGSNCGTCDSCIIRNEATVEVFGYAR